jgi:hypothetical protein
MKSLPYLLSGAPWREREISAFVTKLITRSFCAVASSIVCSICSREIKKSSWKSIRNREQFKETLTFRYFDSEEALVAKFDPRLSASMFFCFNFLYELRISLTYTDVLPGTAKTEIDDSLYTLRQGWNTLVEGVEEKYGWKFKKLEIPDPGQAG